MEIKIVHHKYENVMVEKEIATMITCDCCEGVISENDKYKSPYHFEITTGHHDWGNDSCESIEHQDICSIKCLKAVFNNYLDSVKDCDDTNYIEISREY